jgi:hypothetical protein
VHGSGLFGSVLGNALIANTIFILLLVRLLVVVGPLVRTAPSFYGALNFFGYVTAALSVRSLNMMGQSTRSDAGHKNSWTTIFRFSIDQLG